MSVITTPHDAVFKKYLSHPASARGYLQIYLPDKLFQQYEKPSLNIEPNSLVDENVRALYVDILD